MPRGKKEIAATVGKTPDQIDWDNLKPRRRPGLEEAPMIRQRWPVKGIRLDPRSVARLKIIAHVTGQHEATIIQKALLCYRSECRAEEKKEIDRLEKEWRRGHGDVDRLVR